MVCILFLFLDRGAERHISPMAYRFVYFNYQLDLSVDSWLHSAKLNQASLCSRLHKNSIPQLFLTRMPRIARSITRILSFGLRRRTGIPLMRIA